MSDFPQLEQAWIWPDSVERWFRERTEGRTIHVCCGTSDVGDVTVDRDPDRDPDVVADMNHLPFPDAVFDCGVWDPPWKDPYQRYRPFYELLRVVKPDGRVLANTTWPLVSEQYPDPQPWIRADTARSDVSVLWDGRKHPGQTELGGY